MAGKNGSTQHSALAAAEQVGDGPSQVERVEREPVTEEKKRHPAGGEDAQEKQSTMQSQRAFTDLEPPRGMLDRSLQAQLGRQLRSIFADVANDPVPERFVKLLEALEAREKQR